MIFPCNVRKTDCWEQLVGKFKSHLSLRATTSFEIYTWIKKRNLSFVRLIVLRILHVHDIWSAAKSQRSIFKQSTLIVNISRRGICVCDDVVGSKEGMNIERTTTPEYTCGKTRKRNIINAFGWNSVCYTIARSFSLSFSIGYFCIVYIF